MKRSTIIVTLVLSLFMIFGCASKRYLKQAYKLDKAGLYSDAANLYYNSLQKNNKNIEAKLGLQRTGQMVLDDKAKDFKSKYENASAKDAVYAYRDADAYHKKVASLGVNLIFDDANQTYYKEVEDSYLKELYQKGTKDLSLEQFSSAEVTFAEIIKINKTYKDSHSQWVTAKYEPIYRKGNQEINSQLYRSAYYTFDKIIKEISDYKESIALKTKALENATLTITIKPIAIANRDYYDITTPLATKISNEINSIREPFYKITQVVPQTKNIKIYNYEIFNQLLTQKTVEDRTYNSKAVLNTYIKSFRREGGQLQKLEKRGYLKNTIEVLNKETQQKETKTTYKKIKYYVYSQENKVNLSVKYDLKRIDMNEIPVSNYYSEEAKDNIYYASYDGNYKDLVPGYWKYLTKSSESDQIKQDQNAIKELHQLFNNKKEITSTSELEQQLIANCAKQISSQIEAYKPEK